MLLEFIIRYQSQSDKILNFLNLYAYDMGKKEEGMDMQLQSVMKTPFVL